MRGQSNSISVKSFWCIDFRSAYLISTCRHEETLRVTMLLSLENHLTAPAEKNPRGNDKDNL